MFVGNPPQRLWCMALREKRDLATHHGRGKADEKLVATGEEIEYRGGVRQGIGKLGHAGKKLACGSGSVGLPGQRVVRTIRGRSTEHLT